jgi:tetratricopeptide (TPR) repeat protein
MSNQPIPLCPTAETLALFANGDLDAQTRNAVLAHIEYCSDCMAAVLSASAFLEEERERVAPKENVYTSSRWWMAVAAAIVLAIIAVPFLRQRDPIGRLAALAPRSERGSEARLSGGFAWAPYHGPMRSTDAGVDAGRLKLGGAAGDVIDRAGYDRSAEAQHAAGVAMVLVEKPEEAIVRLEDAARTSHDAKTWSDLAAARYAAAVQLGRASLYPTALAAADAALHINPNLPEALFNRALILERLGLNDEAKRAWQNYLQADRLSPWANEARSHIAAMPVSTR